MTTKQMRLLKAIPKHKTLKSAAIEAGYSPTAGNEYNEAIKSHIKEAIGYDPKAIINAYEDLIMRCKTKGDITNERLAYDSLARINAMFKDKHEITTQSLAPSDINSEVLAEARAILATSL